MAREIGVPPPSLGSIFRVAEFPPGVGGDVVVQQGTNHSWINRGAASCRLAMVFIDAREPNQLK